MNSLQRYVLALSRVLVAIIFLLNGLGIISQAAAAREFVDRGAPADVVPFLMLCARSLEVVAGFGLAFGIYPRLAAMALLAFLFTATLAGHAFWQVAGGNIRKVITDKRDSRIGHARLLKDFFIGQHLLRLFHVDKFHLHFVGAA